jgi:hypothetical protein
MASAFATYVAASYAGVTSFREATRPAILLDVIQLDKTPDAMTARRRTVEHVFGTFKHWMG